MENKQIEFEGKGLDLSDAPHLFKPYQIYTSSFMPMPFEPCIYATPKKKSLLTEIKTRLSHAWYALKGGECE